MESNPPPLPRRPIIVLNKPVLTNAAINIAILLISTLTTLLVAEFYVRENFPFFSSNRFLFFSERAFVQHADGFVHFAPATMIRSVAIYDGRAQFDVTFKTNNMGFVDTRDYPVSPGAKNRFAFVGDSFTAGYHGGAP